MSSVAGTTTVSAFSDIPIDVTGDGIADITLSRSTDGTATPSALTNSGPAEKVWLDGALRWLKHNGIAQLLGGATFEIRRTHDRFGTDIVDDPILTVVDNGAHDTDPTAGEIQVAGLPLGRYTITETAAPPNFNLDPDTEVVILTLANPSNADGSNGDVVPTFINTPRLGNGNARTPGFWGNKNGEAQLKDGGSLEPELLLLRNLNLRNKNGSHFDPTTIKQLKSWLAGGDSTNMAYMLSVHLASMALNVEANFVGGSALVYSPQLLTFAPIAGLSNIGVISINDLMAAANASLGVNGQTSAGHNKRLFQEALKNALDAANNNLNFLIP